MKRWQIDTWFITMWQLGTQFKWKTVISYNLQLEKHDMGKTVDMEHIKEVGNWLIKCVHKRADGNEATMISKASKTEVGEKSKEGRDVYTCQAQSGVSIGSITSCDGSATILVHA
jgi:hypothetical protein